MLGTRGEPTGTVLIRAPAPSSDASSEDWLPVWLGPLVLAGTFAALLAWSFRKWTDPQLDFGVELYIPWQLSEGQDLYRDIAYRNGPLSQYLNSLLFRLFGVSLTTLVYSNLVILAGICAMTYRFFRIACSRGAATFASWVLLCTFGFSQYTGAANYNYVTPYQHYQTHGLALSLALILALVECLRARAGSWARGMAGLGGLCLGLVFLTKTELFVPAAAAALTAWVLITWTRSDTPRLGAIFAVAALAPALAMFAWLSLRMPASLALAGTLGNWAHLAGDLLADPFYLRGAGLDDAVGNALHGLGMLAAIAALGLAAFALERLAPAGWRSGARSAVPGALLFAVLVALPYLVPWYDVARALPFASLLFVLVFARDCWRHERGDAAPARSAPLLIWAVYAFTLLAKMILNARIQQYGFVLAMPATLLLVVVIVHLLPAWLQARDRGGAVARGVGVAAVVAGVVFFLRVSSEIYQRKDWTVGEGGDAILVEGPDHSARGVVISRALQSLEALMPPQSTLLVLPEGVGLNYWLRRENPTRYNLFLPTEIAAFGSDAMLDDLSANAPDYIALVHRSHDDFGVGPFGVDARNGRALMTWVNANYEPVRRIGGEPFTQRVFGVVILRRTRLAPGAEG